MTRTRLDAYIVLLGAHGRGLAAYRRTPAFLRHEAGRCALGVPEGEHVIGLLHLGSQRQEQRAPERAEVDAITTFLG